LTILGSKISNAEFLTTQTGYGIESRRDEVRKKTHKFVYVQKRIFRTKITAYYTRLGEKVK